MSLLGNVVFEMQQTEQVVHLLMSVCFGFSIEKSIEQLKAVYAKKTLGQFQDLLRDQVGLSPAFDELMADFVKRRNFAIHNLTRNTIFRIDTDEGRTKLHGFLEDLRHINHVVKFTFIALTEMWFRKAGKLDARSTERSEQVRSCPFYDEIELFIPTLRSTFGKANAD